MDVGKTLLPICKRHIMLSLASSPLYIHTRQVHRRAEVHMTSQNILILKYIFLKACHKLKLIHTPGSGFALTVWKFCSSVRVFLSTTTGPLSLQWKASSILRYEAIPSSASRVVGSWLCPLALSTKALLSVASE